MVEAFLKNNEKIVKLLYSDMSKYGENAYANHKETVKLSMNAIYKYS